MSTRIELADGNWAEIRDPKKVNERRRRAYIVSMSEFNRSKADVPMVTLPGTDGAPDRQVHDPERYGAAQQAALDDTLDLLIVCLVESWSFDLPISVESLAELTTDVFDPIKAACIALSSEVLPDYGPSPDPKAGGGRSTRSRTASPKAAG